MNYNELRTIFTGEMIGLMCVQAEHFSGHLYRSRLEIIMTTYQNVFRRFRTEEALSDRDR